MKSGGRSPRILFVGFSESVHTARWISQLDGLGWDIRVFGVTDQPPHAELTNATSHRLVRSLWRGTHGRQAAIPWPLPRGETKAAEALRRLRRFAPAVQLARLIRKWRPDMVHSLEMQHGGYLTLAARELLNEQFPPWIYSAWGSDLFLFGEKSVDRERIRAVLGSCDYVFVDCARDVQLAKTYGFKGELLGIVPGGGGFELAACRRVRSPGPVSFRRVIAVKGYQGKLGARGLVAVQALAQCADVLAGYEVVIYSPAEEVKKAATSLKTCGIGVTVLPQVSHQDMLRLFGRSRIAIGLGISDGSPNTLLEAMIMGAFPIQSDTISTREWINRENGLLVSAESVVEVGHAIRRALAEPDLVNSAAEVNARIADEKLDRESIRTEVVAIYRRILAGAAQAEGVNA